MADLDWILPFFREAIEPSASSKPVILKLLFLDEVISPVYTGKDIIGKPAGGDGRNINNSIRVMLFDGETNQQVTTGPAAFATVKVVLLPATFGGDWTPIDFQNSIIIDRGKKKNLLLGNRTVVLENGIGTVGPIRIKHDRIPLKTDRFRLGAMVVDCGLVVKEAITDPFEVKDRRNESKDSRRLMLTDKVSCLKNIGKRGRIVLEDKGVLTVGDFVKMHDSNPRGLQEICRLTGRRWETALHHAKRCRIDDMVDGYNGSVGSTSQLPNSNSVSVFDSIDSYIPQPWEDGPSVQDYVEDGLVLSGNQIWFNPCPGDGTDGAATKVISNGGEGRVGLAKKRWKKVRVTLCFSSLVSCLKAGLGNVSSTLASYAAGSKVGATLAD